MKTKNNKNSARDFPVVCVGGSAGGLDAYTRLLQNLPADMGVAIVIVNHLRTVATMLPEILPRYTKMPVKLITEKLDIQPNHVFIIPEQRDLHVLNDEFRLKPISKHRGWPDVITVFLRSITKHWEGKLIAVIVSGYDGAEAVRLYSRHSCSFRWYSTANLPGANCNDGDPIVLWDEQANRWFYAELSVYCVNNRMLIAVSTTSDPTDTWYSWSFDMVGNHDYPKFGIWQDGYYMATNTSNGNDVYVFDREAMVAGEPTPDNDKF